MQMHTQIVLKLLRFSTAKIGSLLIKIRPKSPLKEGFYLAKRMG